MDEAAIVSDIDEVRRELERAADGLLDAADAGLAALTADPPCLDEARRALQAVLEAASFGDLCGQRLARCRAALLGQAELRPEAHLLAGPGPADALDQAAVDLQFSAAV